VESSLQSLSFLFSQWANKHWCIHVYSMSCTTALVKYLF
jgi:hypothetical protein